MTVSNKIKRLKFWLSGLVLLAPCWYFYQSLNPVFPTEWQEKTIGPFTAALTPANNAPAYPHDGDYLKDFSVRFCEGCTPRIRTAYLQVGSEPLPVSTEVEGILHGHGNVLHVHAPYPLAPTKTDKLWLTVQTWDGQVFYEYWDLPTADL